MSRLFLAISLTLVPTWLAAQTPELSDARVSAAVEAEFVTQRGIPPAVDADVTDGIVTLTGTVDSLLHRQRAEDVTSRVKGVRGIVNRIAVDVEPRADAAIRADIERALAEDPAADSWDVTPAVDGGQVTLIGTVDSWQERKFAEMVTLGVHGVRSVKNDVEIEYSDDRSPAEIADDVTARLTWDSRVDDRLIEVDVEDDTVELTGTVGSYYEKKRAESDAWVTGVGEVDTDALKIKWWARDEMLRKEMFDKSDAEVAEAVIDTFVYDPRVGTDDITVVADDGSVTLTGDVQSFRAKHAAEENARNVIGVWRVRNLLDVELDDEIDDAVIAGNLQSALIDNPFAESYEIDFSVSNGEVYLDGEVDSLLEKTEAAREARQLDGVTHVHNGLEVDPDVGFQATSDLDADSVTDDYELREDIRDQLFWSPWVDRNQVDVTVDDGVARLEGTVDTWFERRKATENALEAGAVAVVNKLDITFGPDLPIL